jgi:DNA (cytosine-5)-methyltransferase 1
MGFPDNYTDIPKAKPTNRYQGLGNSWAVPVIRWLGKRIVDYKEVSTKATAQSVIREAGAFVEGNKGFEFFNISSSGSLLAGACALNGSEMPREIALGKMFDIIDVEAAENFYISPVGCKGILRRKEERQLSINPKLEVVLKSVSSQWTSERIEKISKRQSRGRFSSPKPHKGDKQHMLF